MTSATTAREDVDYLLFQRRIKERTGIDLASYKRPQMERRLRALANQAGAKTFREYFHLLERSPELLEVFRRRVTINVSELFRNPDKFEELQRSILPQLATASGPFNAWSAGCSYGAEAYSVAIVLLELFGQAQQPRVLATDVDEEMLALAREGRFSEADMKNVSRLRRAKFFMPEAGGWRATEALRQMIEFRHHDLLADPFEPGFHLILCRNVVIYFTDEAKQRLYGEFHAGLVPGGVLFIGGTEHIIGARELGFEPISAFFYRKMARSALEER